MRDLTCDEVGLCGGTYPDCAVGHAARTSCERAEVTLPDERIYSVTTCPVAGGSDGAAVVQIAKNVTLEIGTARRLRHMSDELAATNARLLATVDRLKTTQAQLLQAEKLSAIGQLVAGVAHELNNPLTSVIGYAQLVEDELRSTSADQPVRPATDLARDLRRIAEESERAARIVRNLLAFARRQTAERAPQDIADLVGRVLALRAYEFRLSGIELEAAFEPKLPRVLADRRPAAAGAAEPAAQRRAGDARPDDAALARRRAAMSKTAAAVELFSRRHRPRHLRREPAPDLRSVLHHARRRRGHRPRPQHLLRHRARSRRPDPRSRAGSAVGTTFSILLPARLERAGEPPRRRAGRAQRADRARLRGGRAGGWGHEVMAAERATRPARGCAAGALRRGVRRSRADCRRSRQRGASARCARGEPHRAGAR